MAILILSLALGQNPTGSANPLLGELVEKGLPIAGLTYRFPVPLLPDKFDAKQQQAALEKAADRHSPDLFVRKSIVAPFTLKIESLTDKDGQRQGQAVDLYFVAHGRLESLTKKDVLNLLIRSETKDAKAGPPRFLTDEDLQKRKITNAAKDAVEERYAVMDLQLLDKVQVTGVTRNVKTRSAKGLTMAMMLDPRFADDAQFPNRWRAIQQPDALHAYAGLGGYVKVSELTEPAGSLLMEIHVAFHEPQAWFDGKNYIRAKLPIAIQTNVRSFRRQLMQAAR